MSFKQTLKVFTKHANKVLESSRLFKVNVSGEVLWDTYLSNLKSDVFRHPQSNEDNCNNDRHFIMTYGNVVAVDPTTYQIVSLWPELDEKERYYKAFKEMDRLCKEATIESIFKVNFEDLSIYSDDNKKSNLDLFRIGYQDVIKTHTKADKSLNVYEEGKEHPTLKTVAYNVVNNIDKYNKPIVGTTTIDYDTVKCELNKTYTFSFFNASIHRKHVVFNTTDALRLSQSNDHVSMTRTNLGFEISHIDMVIEALNSNRMWNNETRYIKALNNLKELIISNPTENAIWLKSDFVSGTMDSSNIREALKSLKEGEDFDTVIREWNKRTDPSKYKITEERELSEREANAAQKFLVENGYDQLIQSRVFASVKDIVPEFIEYSRQSNGTVKATSLFDVVKTTKGTIDPKQFDKAKEISMEDFMSLTQSAKSFEVLFENRLISNLVTLVTSDKKSDKNLFSWSNPVSWTYKDNAAGKSRFTELVKSYNAKTDVPFRATLVWSGDGKDDSDLDLHLTAIDAKGYKDRCYYGHRTSECGAQLDVDIRTPLTECKGKQAIENIVYEKMPNNIQRLELYVNGFRVHSSNKGFEFELVTEKGVTSYSYTKKVGHQENVNVATIHLDNGKVTSIEHHLDPIGFSVSDKPTTVWGLDTMQFHPCTLVCPSPNHWGDNDKGVLHWFFILDGCKSDEPIRPYHAAQLNGELRDYKRFLEELGKKYSIPASDYQLAGVGFNSTDSDYLIAKVLMLDGTSKVHKVKFN